MSLNWGAQQLRLTIFADSLVSATEQDWRTITEQAEPDRVSIPGGKSFVGPYSAGQLTLSYSGKRIDIVLAPLPTEEFKLPIVGSWELLCTMFIDGTTKWLNQLNMPVVRLAFAGSLFLETETREEAYTELDKLLASVTVKPQMHELLFRVNWPRRSTVEEELVINRITQWSSNLISKKLLLLAGDQMSQVDAGEPSIQAVRLDFDHNTDQARTAIFDSGQVVPIYHELAELARETAEKGECE
jgi:hypothetical protein